MINQDLEENFDFKYESELIEQYRQQKYKEYNKHKNKRKYNHKKYLKVYPVFWYTSDEITNNQMSAEFNGYKGIGSDWGTMVSRMTPRPIREIVNTLSKDNEFGVSVRYLEENSFSRQTLEYVVVNLNTHEYNILYAEPDDYIKELNQPLDLVGTINGVNDKLTGLGVSQIYQILEIDLKILKPYRFDLEKGLLEDFLISGYFSKYHNTLDSVFKEYKTLRGVTPIGWENNVTQVLCNVNKRIPKIIKYYSNKTVNPYTKNRGQYKNYSRVNRKQTKQELNQLSKYYDNSQPYAVEDIVDEVSNLKAQNMNVEWD